MSGVGMFVCFTQQFSSCLPSICPQVRMMPTLYDVALTPIAPSQNTAAVVWNNSFMLCCLRIPIFSRRISGFRSAAIAGRSAR